MWEVLAGDGFRGSLLKRGWTLNASRKSALLLYALAVTPIMISARHHDCVAAVVLIAIAAGTHQAWPANIYMLASDMFPRCAVASVVGFATMAGCSAECLFPRSWAICSVPGSYVPVFVMADVAYPAAFGSVNCGAAAEAAAGVISRQVSSAFSLIATVPL